MKYLIVFFCLMIPGCSGVQVSYSFEDSIGNLFRTIESEGTSLKLETVNCTFIELKLVSMCQARAFLSDGTPVSLVATCSTSPGVKCLINMQAAGRPAAQSSSGGQTL